MKWDVDWLEARSRLFPEKTGVVDSESEQEWTYRDLYVRSLYAEEKLKNAGVQNGDRIAFLGPNHISSIDYMFAAKRMGAVFVPLNWRLAEEELAYIISDCSPRVLIYHEKFCDKASLLHCPVKISSGGADPDTELESDVGSIRPEAAFVSMDAPWMIIYTGGTTGKPKGVVLTNRCVYTNAVNTIISWEISSDDVTLSVMPMFHTGGINALTLPVLFAGGKVVLASGFEPDRSVELLRKYGCTLVLLVPTMYHDLIQSEAFRQALFPEMKAFLSGGAPCPLSVYQAFAKKGLPFKEGYGLTEAGPNNFFITTERARLKPGTVGKPMVYNSVRIVDDQFRTVSQGEAGELAVYGEHVFSNYWKNEKETAGAFKGSWLLTGDMARQDKDGDYYILGRKKDMVITGGENVYPQEVEQVINEHPAVKDIAVVGIPDERWGEIVTAIVVPYDGKMVTIHAIEEYCAKRLARYKVPKRVYITDRLPVTPVGKIDKKQLVSAYAPTESG